MARQKESRLQRAVRFALEHNVGGVWPYIAGIIDGEGCFSIDHRLRNNRNSHAVRITVVQRDGRLTDWLAKTTGMGKLYWQESHGKKMHRWKILRVEEIRTLLQNIMPYLIVKREQAELLLECCDSKKRTRGAMIKLRKLKREWFEDVSSKGRSTSKSCKVRSRT